MRKGEMLKYISNAGTVLFANNKLLSNYWWNEAEGLDGIENNLYTMKGAGQDGESLIGKSLQARVITIDGQICNNIVAAKRKLIRTVNPKHTGKLIYSDGEITRYIPCEIQKAPAIARNGKYPEFQIEFFCPYPFWREGDGTAQNITEMALWVPAFQFELEIPEDGFEFGYRSPALIVNVINNGEVEAGMMIELRAVGATSNPSITNISTQEKLSLTHDMVAGDIIRVSTGYGEKRAELEKGGIITNIFNSVDADSTWLQLDVGDNLLRYDATETDNIEVTIYYDMAYLGV
jgi:hypothetical protein